jgi:hypothetical protein
VLAYIEQEDMPRSLAFQLDQMRAAGFHDLEVLHKNVNFAPSARGSDRLPKYRCHNGRIIPAFRLLATIRKKKPVTSTGTL